MTQQEIEMATAAVQASMARLIELLDAAGGSLGSKWENMSYKVAHRAAMMRPALEEIEYLADQAVSAGQLESGYADECDE